MSRGQNVPEVDAAAEFLEIVSDCRDPRDAVREAISSTFDAGANTISVQARIEKFEGDDELVVGFEDDGAGMILEAGAESDTPNIKAFFDLGRSTWRAGERYIGKKGHGTKTYFNCRQIEVYTIEVYVLKDYLKERLGIEFRPRGVTRE